MSQLATIQSSMQRVSGPRGPSRLALASLAGLSGALLFISDYPVHAWPLQLIALLPLLAGLDRLCRSSSAAALAGLSLGLLYSLPLLYVLEFPISLGLPLALYLTLIWVLLAVGMFRALRWKGEWGALGAGAVAVLLEWVDFTLVPVWGTAQCFARVWSAAPRAIQIVSLTGVTGLVFTLVASQGLLLRLVLERGSRARLARALAVLAALVLAWSGYAWLRSSPGSLRVAAIGWTSADLKERGATESVPLFEKVFRPLVEQAASQGAQLVVSPEVGFMLTAGEREPILQRASELARRRALMLALGYFDREQQENRVVFIDAHGARVGEYIKTHLIPFVESYRPGRGELTLVRLDGALLGAMICQDDNFTDLGRAYGRAGAQLLAVPTNDWAQVKEYHLENSLFRAAENQFAVVRGASNGVSAIVSPRGELLARKDHFREGPGVIVAQVPLGRGRTVYALAGDWLPAACLVGLVLGVVAGWLRRRVGTSRS